MISEILSQEAGIHLNDDNPAWLTTKVWLQAELERVKKELCHDLGKNETAALRGEARFIERALRLPEILNKAAIKRPQRTRLDAGQEG